MKKSLYVLFTLSSIILNSQVNYQPRTCGTPTLPTAYEGWVNSLAQNNSSGPKGSSSSIQSIYSIPVVVHIIHNNEPINSNSATSGNNISAAQVLSQLNRLNLDYAGTNADTASIPTVFKPALGKFQISFCLAVVNPSGGILAEPGIDRINRVAQGWSGSPYSQTYIDATIKPASIWDPNKYLNIWVCALGNSLLGYATFPNPGTSGLAGLSAPYGTTSSDGVVILNTAFGSVGTAAFGAYNLGRTSTHEIGHWMGLRHIWGDGTCATDYVNDTPPHQNANFGCPGFPYKVGTCSGNSTGEMTMNYMDYTNDACLYMFTKDQKIRSQLIMNNSPMRTALLSSTVCNLPSISTDPGISYVAVPGYSQAINCVNSINPVIAITNYGTSTITSLVVTYNVDGLNTQIFNWTGSINPTATLALVIPQITGLSNGVHNFSANISAPNGGTDNNLSNNNNVQNFSIANVMTVTVNSPTTCAGAAVTLSATGGVSYSWINVGTGASVSVSPSVTTVYTVVASNSMCNVSKTTTINVTPGPIMAVNTASNCAGLTSTLIASGALSYSWNAVAGTSVLTVNPNSTTVYTVSGDDATGCVSKKTTTVTVLYTPTVAINNATVCTGITATLIPSGATSYSWSDGSTGNVLMVTPVTSSTYFVIGTTGTCSDTKTVSVSIGSALSMYINPLSPEICVGGAQSLSVTGANTYTWSTGSNNAVISVSPITTTVYSVNGSASGCQGSSQITVTANALPVTAIALQSVSCFGGSNGAIGVSSTGNGPFTYSYPSGSVNLSAGFVSVITTDNKGCVSTSTAIIIQPLGIGAQTSVGDTRCSASCDGTAQINITGGFAPYTNTIFPSGALGTNFLNLCAGNYTSYITDGNGCVSLNTFTINPGNTGIAINTTITNVSCGTCSDATLTANGSSGTAPYTYTWNPGPFYGAVLIDVPVGCYTVQARDASGCNNETEVCVLFDLGINNFILQNNLVLSPNPTTGIFNLKGLNAGTSNIEVFDARGKLVISKTVNDSSVELDLSSCSEGIYYARVVSGQQTAVARIVKQ